MAKAKKAKKEVSEGPKVISEIIIRAFDNADVAVTFPEKSNVWVLRGVLAKALDTLNKVTVAEDRKK